MNIRGMKIEQKDLPVINTTDGDIFESCNLSYVDLTDEDLTFKRCNLSFCTCNGVPIVDADGNKVQHKHTYINCRHTNNNKLPPEPDQTEVEQAEIDTVLDRLGELTIKHPGKVSAGIKSRQSLQRFNQVMSADGKPVKVEDLSGEWK